MNFNERENFPEKLRKKKLNLISAHLTADQIEKLELTYGETYQLSTLFIEWDWETYFDQIGSEQEWLIICEFQRFFLGTCQIPIESCVKFRLVQSFSEKYPQNHYKHILNYKSRLIGYYFPLLTRLREKMSLFSVSSLGTLSFIW